MHRRIILCTLILCHFLFIPGAGYGDESGLFYAKGVNGLIILDRSGSMGYDPTGLIWEAGNNLACKSALGAQSISNMLGGVWSTLDTQFGIGFGFSEFSGCAFEPQEGCMPGKWGGGDGGCFCFNLIDPIGTPYAQIATDTRTYGMGCGTGYTEGGTPLDGILKAAGVYLDSYQKTNPNASCTQNFVILITDGLDTLSCGGTGGDTCDDIGIARGTCDMYKRRKASVAAAKALADKGYKLFVVGFGSMPSLRSILRCPKFETPVPIFFVYPNQFSLDVWNEI